LGERFDGLVADPCLASASLLRIGRPDAKRPAAVGSARMARTWLILPTYDEAENVEAIVAAAAAALERAAPGDWRLLVVDDASPDGTGALADALAARAPEVEVLHRTAKDGLGRAYLAGFAHALDRGAARVVEMDADFSHDPAYIPDFLAAIEKHDVVIGSRYVPGGGTRDWSKTREFISRGGSLYARILTGLKVKDSTSGFRCYRKKVLEAIDFSRIEASGYAFQVEMAYVCTIMGFDVFELPIVFVDRTAGTSKMSKSIVFEAMRLVAGLKKKYRDINNNKRL